MRAQPQNYSTSSLSIIIAENQDYICFKRVYSLKIMNYKKRNRLLKNTTPTAIRLEKDALYFYTVGDLFTASAFTESRQLDQDQYYEKAIGFYEIAAEKDPRFVNAVYKKGLIQLAMGDLNSANETYQALQTQDPKLATALEGKIVTTINAYKTARANYYRELSKEHLVDNMTLLLYSIVEIVTQSGYYYRY